MEKVKTPVKISDSEWEIMRVIWTLGQTTAQEITQILADSMDWKPATIKLCWDVGKKRSDLEQNKKEKNSFIIQLSQRWKQFEVRRKIFFPYLCKKDWRDDCGFSRRSYLTQEDINEILKQLEKKQPVETIECNCIPGQCECKQHQ